MLIYTAIYGKSPVLDLGEDFFIYFFIKQM